MLGLAGFGQSLMQSGADLVGRIRVALSLIADHKRSPGGDTDETGHPQPLPQIAHVPRLFAARTGRIA